MAPRRGGYSGGSSGSSGSSSSSSNQCALAGAFDDTLSRVGIAFQAIFIVGGVAVLAAYLVQRARGKGVGRSAPFYLYGLGLLLWIIGYILDLVAIVLNECEVSDSSTLLNLNLAEIWLYAVSICLLLATALFPVCAQLHRTFNSNRFRMVKWVHAALLLLLCVLFLTSSAYTTWLSSRRITTSYRYYSYSQSILIANRLAAARYFIEAVAVLAAGTSMIVAWSQGRKLGSRSTVVLVWALVFTISLLTAALARFGQIVQALTSPRRALVGTDLAALLIVIQFLELVAFASILGLANLRPVSLGDTNESPHRDALFPNHGQPEIMQHRP